MKIKFLILFLFIGFNATCTMGISTKEEFLDLFTRSIEFDDTTDAETLAFLKSNKFVQTTLKKSDINTLRELLNLTAEYKMPESNKWIKDIIAGIVSKKKRRVHFEEKEKRMHTIECQEKFFCELLEILKPIASTDKEVISFLETNKTHINFINPKSGYNILHLLSIYNQPKAIKWLLQNRDSNGFVQNIDAKSLKGATALYCAACNNNSEIARCLLKHNAYVDERTEGENSHTPLYIASQAGYTSTMRVLMQAGADVNAELTNNTIKGQAPLHAAILGGKGEKTVFKRIEAINSLLKYKAGPNSKTTSSAQEYLYTPLHMAVVCKSHKNIIMSLLLAQANPEAINKDQETPLDLAKRIGNEEAAGILKKVIVV